MCPLGLTEARAAAAVGAHGALPTRNRRGHPKDTARAVFRAANRSAGAHLVQHGQFPAHHLIVHGERRGLRFEGSDTLAWRRSYVCPGVAWDGDHPSVRRCRFFLRLDGAPAYATPKCVH